MSQYLLLEESLKLSSSYDQILVFRAFGRFSPPAYSQIPEELTVINYLQHHANSERIHDNKW